MTELPAPQGREVIYHLDWMMTATETAGKSDLKD